MFDGRWERDGRDIIKAAAEDSNTSMSALARRLGISRQLLYEWINWRTDKHDISADCLAAALRECGYVLLAVRMDFELGDPVYVVNWKGAVKNRKKQKRGRKGDGVREVNSKDA